MKPHLLRHQAAVCVITVVITAADTTTNERRHHRTPRDGKRRVLRLCGTRAESSCLQSLHLSFLLLPTSLILSLFFLCVCFTFSVECWFCLTELYRRFLRVIPNGIQHHSLHISTFPTSTLTLWHNRQDSQTANSATRLVLNSETNNRSVMRSGIGSIIANYFDIIQKRNIPFNGKTPWRNHPGFSCRALWLWPHTYRTSIEISVKLIYSEKGKMTY